MNDIMEKILSTPHDDFERVLYRAEEWLLLLEGQIAYSARVSAVLDRSYDLLLAGLIASDDDDLDETETAIADKTRDMVRQFRGFRDTDNGKLLTYIFAELHALHRLYRDKTP
jgi:hypothetical protein